MSAFKEAQIEHLLASGWRRCDRIAGLIQERGLPAIGQDYLAGVLSPPLSGNARRRLWEH